MSILAEKSKAFSSETQLRMKHLVDESEDGVRNLRDGRVEALFEGEKENVQAMIEFCWRGPGLAKVKNVDVEWEPYVGDEELFETR